tara:strand:- start:623 stop:1039 length:417 start_codon:yes stop_codon:yes gene_type:complete
MKNLLFITLLFSTTAFTNINLICDKPYYFFPDLEQRVLLSFDSTENIVSRINLSNNLMEVLDRKHTYAVTNEYYKWGYLQSEFVYLYTVNRSTLEYINSYMPSSPEFYKCKKIDDIEYQDAKKDLEDYSQKVKDKRKI